MPRYQVTIYYRNPNGNPQTFVDEVLAPDECIAVERAERVCRAARKVHRIDGGDVFLMRAGKTIRPRDPTKKSAKRRVIVIIPEPGSMECNDLYDWLVNEMDNAKIKSSIYTTATNLLPLSLITEGLSVPNVISSPREDRHHG